ncbi:MAG: hypothetical protein RLZ10_1320 [Bacteroidota bacterium]|jgi:hypothetical protein
MLVDKKFIFISLPRCASTSFMITCFKNKIPIEHVNSNLDNQLINISEWKKLSNEELADSLVHPHESLYKLQEKFGFGNEIISIRRNKYSRFLSLWKHIIDELHRIEKFEIADIFSKLTTNEIFDNITSNDIYNFENRYDVIINFLTKLGISKEESYTINMLDILFMPVVELTNNDPNIIWFDIDNLSELENWVSKKLNTVFKMEKINSSKHFNTVIEMDDVFKQKYDNLFMEFDERKINKTLI